MYILPVEWFNSPYMWDNGHRTIDNVYIYIGVTYPWCVVNLISCEDRCCMLVTIMLVLVADVKFTSKKKNPHDCSLLALALPSLVIHKMMRASKDADHINRRAANKPRKIN